MSTFWPLVEEYTGLAGVENMNWCCLGFEAHYETAGQRGLAYLIGRDSIGVPEFMIQYRAVDKGNETHIQTDIPASIVIDARIVFCPHCGANLAQFYANEIDGLYRDGFEIGFLKEN